MLLLLLRPRRLPPKRRRVWCKLQGVSLVTN